MKRLTIMTGTLVLLGLAVSISFYPSASSENTSSGRTPNQDATAVKKDKLDLTIVLEDPIPMNLSTSNPDSVAAFNADSFVKPTDKELKERLSAIEYKVTQKEGTERPFSNTLNDEKRAGLYVDIVSGEPLFSSIDKYDSGTGWPSFARPIDTGAVIEKRDISVFGVRTEIRSALADSHLGHVFNDGPAPTGQRYCMNSASMRFIPLDQMVKSGYEAYVTQVSVKDGSS